MLLDAADVDAGPGGELSADVVIVGAGAAGIVMALELSRRGIDVLVLEAGGLPPDESRNEDFLGDDVGLGYDLVWSRYRGLGGSTNAWGGWCRPLDSIELESHQWTGGLPWPIGHDELLDLSRAAAELIDLGAWKWNASGIAADEGKMSLADLPRANEQLSSVLWRYVEEPLSFADRFRSSIENSSARFLLNAPVSDVRIDAGRAQKVVASRRAGSDLTVSFGTMVIAAGGVESVRLLLELQARLQSEGKGLDLGGWLGRGWQEHPHVPIGVALIPEFILEGPLWLMAQRRDVEGVPVMAGLTLPEKVVREMELAVTSITLYGQVKTHLAPYAQGLRYVAESVAGGSVQARQLFARSESRTTPESRLTLGRDLDRWGRPRVQLDWRVDEQDYRDIATVASAMAQAFESLGLGVVHHDAGVETLRSRVGGGAHHIGGARMSQAPEDGVTNEYGALHAIPNIFVAGSASFPSGGFSNPTLTILALALRQVDVIAAGG